MSNWISTYNSAFGLRPTEPLRPQTSYAAATRGGRNTCSSSSSPPDFRIELEPSQNHSITLTESQATPPLHSPPFSRISSRSDNNDNSKSSPPPPGMPTLAREITIITSELSKKLNYGSQFSAPVYHRTERREQGLLRPGALTRVQLVPDPTNHSWNWHDSSYVRLPFSKLNGDGRGSKWNFILKNLLNLKKQALDMMEKGGGRPSMFRDAVCAYSGKARSSNFDIVQKDEYLYNCLVAALPGIIDHAMKLPARLEEPIQILKQERSFTLCLSRNVVCSLLANAFLCTFPEQGGGRNLPYFNFYTLFDHPGNPEKATVKREKLKCILAYFEQMSSNPPPKNTIITFERRCYPRKYTWSTSTDHLCPLKLFANQKLEETKGMLQVDFANRHIGGGVLNDGSVQEEIRFCISPELICARLFTEPLNHDEVLVVTGTAKFSSYSGYSSTFKYEELEGERSTETDDLGREFTQIVAMDAIHFQPYEKRSQYRPEKIDRELHKCYVGFTQGKHPTPVSTGNWGCGAFNGDPQLKFLIQWMAASVHKRTCMVFHAVDDTQLQELNEMATVLCEKSVTVGKLYKILIKFESKQWKKNLFHFVIKSLNDNGFLSSLFR